MPQPKNCNGENLRELTARLSALRELLDERDKLYTERDKSRSEAVQSAFFASKEAITKSETSQKQYNDSHNDLARKMDSQYQQMLPRQEAEARFGTLETRLEEKCEALMVRITDLSDSRSQGRGKSELFTPLMWLVASLIGGLIVFFVQRAIP